VSVSEKLTQDQTLDLIQKFESLNVSMNHQLSVNYDDVEQTRRPTADPAELIDGKLVSRDALVSRRAS
jgi:hypothetical protein